MAAAVLTIDINARLAKLEEGLNQANRRLGSFKSTVDGFGNSIKNAFGAIGIGVAVGKFIALTKAAIDSADHLNDLSKTTGIAATTLGGIGFAAEQAGSSLDGLIPSLGKLNIEIAKAAAGNPEAAATFKALKLDVIGVGGATKDAGQVLIELAGKFETFQDGPQKAALANALFKKGFAELVPLLNEGADSLRKNIAYYEKYSGLTTDLTQKADKFNDEVAKINLLHSAFFRVLAAELLPALTGYSQALVDAKEKTDGYRESAKDVANVIKGAASAAIVGASAFAGLGDAIGGIIAADEAFGHLRFREGYAILNDIKARIGQRIDDTSKLLDRLNNPKPDTGPGKPKPTIQAPGLPNQDSQKKILDAQIRAFEDAIKDEQQMLATREHFLQAYYQDDEINLREFFAQRQSAINDALEKENAAFDEIINLRKKAVANSAGDDRVKAEADLAEAIRKRGEAQRQASIKGADLFFEERRALKAFRDDIEQTSIRLLALSGDRVGAALAQFDFSNKQRTVKIGIELDSPDEEVRRLAGIAQQGLDTEREQIKLQAQLNTVSDEFGDILERVGIAQSRIEIARSRGAITELEALRASGEANRAMIPLLQRQADLYQEIADKFADPKAQLAADQLRLKIEQLGASTDLVAKKFQDVFVDSFASALEKVTQKGAKLKDILKALEQDIVAGISRIASRNISESLFKADGPLGGVGKFFGDLFGGKSGDSTGAAALTGAGATLTSAGALLTTAASELLVAATTLAASSVSNAALAGIPGLGSAGTFGGGFFNPFEGAFGFASGTDFAPGGFARVGEHGPELVRLPRGSQVVPHSALPRGGTVVNAPITISVQGVATSRTADQIGLQVSRGLMRSTRRIG